MNHISFSGLMTSLGKKYRIPLRDNGTDLEEKTREYFDKYSTLVDIRDAVTSMTNLWFSQARITDIVVEIDDNTY